IDHREQARSYRGGVAHFLSDPHNHSSAKSLLLFINPGESRPCFGQGAACRIFPTRPDRVATDRNVEIPPDE
ncbi:hypothetical protein, partial [Pseudomonas sp. BF-R-12]|uniref:hypothetical protein n=1 Tax=Pseudomonas sp. BF-R-12 TaxID=2832363 RepID=UPI001CBF60D7